MNLADDDVALDAAKAIDEQHAVEMIDFVLQRASQQPGPVDRSRAAVAVQATHDHARGTGNRRIEARQAQAAFLFELHPVAFDKFWIDEGDQVAAALADAE